MTSLPDLLDELAGSTPPPAVDAGAAWADGRRQRRRRFVVRAGAVAIVVALVALVVPTLHLSERVPTYARPSGAVVDGHPARIGRQWLVRDLPDRPGPLAALLSVSVPQGGWDAVRSDGHRWHLPEVFSASGTDPILSPDGTLLGSLAGPDGPFVLHDLVSGRRTELGELGDSGVYQRRSTYGLYPQTPAAWSPDGRQVLLSAFSRSPQRSGYVLLDIRSGRVRVVAIPTGARYLAGWTASDEVAWIGEGQPREDVALVLADVTGRTVRRVPLRATSTVRDLSQFSARVQRSTATLLLSSPAADEHVGTLRRFSLATGAQTAPPVEADTWSSCGVAAGARRLVAPLGPGGPALAGEVHGGDVRPFTVAWPGLGASCLVWATRAVDGPARGAGLLGTSTAGWTWWWKELALGGAVLVGAAVLWRRRPPRRRAPQDPDVDWYAWAPLR